MRQREARIFLEDVLAVLDGDLAEVGSDVQLLRDLGHPQHDHTLPRAKLERTAWPQSGDAPDGGLDPLAHDRDLVGNVRCVRVVVAGEVE